MNPLVTSHLMSWVYGHTPIKNLFGGIICQVASRIAHILWRMVNAVWHCLYCFLLLCHLFSFLTSWHRKIKWLHTSELKATGASTISKCSFRLHTWNLVLSYKKWMSVPQLVSCCDIGVFISKATRHFQQDSSFLTCSAVFFAAVTSM